MRLIILCSCSTLFIFLLFLQDDYVRTWDENQGSNDSKSLTLPHHFLIVWLVKGASNLHALMPFVVVVALIYDKVTSKIRPGSEKFGLTHLWSSFSPLSLLQHQAQRKSTRLCSQFDMAGMI